MKIMLFRHATSEEDGSTKVLVWLANTLRRHGHDVIVLSRDNTRNEPFYPLDSGVGLLTTGDKRLKNKKPGLKITKRLKKAVNRYGGEGNYGRRFMAVYAGFVCARLVDKALMAAARARRSLSTSSFSRTAGKGTYYGDWQESMAPAITRVTEILRKEKPDLVVSFFTGSHFLIAEAARRSGIPIVCSYQNDVRIYSRRIGEKFTELSKALPPQAITILNPIFYSDLSSADRKIAHVIPNYIPESSSTHDNARRRNVIISVGRLNHQKNHELLIDAFAKLEKEFSDWQVEIYGAGELKNALERKIFALGLGGRVLLKGTTSDIDAAYSEASIHAFPSLYEGFGLVVIEAMSNGLPMVGVAGVYPPAHFVSESGAGLLAAPSPDDFAAKLRELMSDQQLRDTMRERAVAYAKTFSSEKVLSLWISLFESVRKNGLAPTKSQTHDQVIADTVVDRLPIPDSAIPPLQHSRVSKHRRKGKEAAPTHAWDAPIPSKLGYPRLHPENAYDALDFLREEKVSELNRAVVERIRESVSTSGRKIRVGFVVSEKEKWNGDPLVQALDASGHFEWSFATCLSKIATKQTPIERALNYEQQVAYFRQKGPVAFQLFDAARDCTLPVEDLDYDLVFLQQPWAMKDFPRRLIGKSLCAYMHYGFMMMANHGMHYNIASFHSYLWKYFTQTQLHRQMHLQHDPSAVNKLLVTGYPKLDVYREPPPPRTAVRVWKTHFHDDRRRVIFAPHHSLGNTSLGMATFRWSGEAMAALRQQCQDIDWVYKPHPTLAFSIVRNKVMSAEEYTVYVNGWAKGENSSVYDEGDYFDVFRSSDALVTDCGSFLAEYLPTGKPIIWLVSDETVGLNEVGEHLAKGFYQVRTVEELNRVFQQVVIDGDDHLAAVRQSAIEQVLPGDKTSSAAVVDDLIKTFVMDDENRQHTDLNGMDQEKETHHASDCSSRSLRIGAKTP
ncbi:glycosyltransferase [Halomonas sp. BM-2019]|uniref:glycosyltransferase n=1 Tax=Halomonas sp. BM-2019 TaxID=2811227 RepID=UPI001B3C1CD9|nr:MAG: glycosyltransferase [Halomonas sp. BM-2019]